MNGKREMDNYGVKWKQQDLYQRNESSTYTMDESGMVIRTVRKVKRISKTDNRDFSNLDRHQTTKHIISTMSAGSGDYKYFLQTSSTVHVKTMQL
ncbi:hypothetical protein Avbf_17411 [Armadillidium vulgare]|nr:hypothetical protein Avbf_17411 [Armadillidium vulgare]